MTGTRLLILLATLGIFPATAQTLHGVPVRNATADNTYTAEAMTEAVRQSVIAAQVAGRIMLLPVKAGDRVQQGQILVRIDAQAASQQAKASRAQVDAARAQLDVARREFERQQQLFARQYISQAALEQAEAQFKATRATVQSSLAQAGSAQTQTGFYTLRAPFSGVISEVSAESGDMAMPGRPLLTLYDPTRMRVVASLPQNRLKDLRQERPVRISLGSTPANDGFNAATVTVLPTVNPETHTVLVRLAVPAGQITLPGQFARAYFPLRSQEGEHLFVPASTVIHRAELDAVYVLTDGRAMLRQVRIGESMGQDVEILSGVHAGEMVALDPVMAARQGQGK